MEEDRVIAAAEEMPESKKRRLEDSSAGDADEEDVNMQPDDEDGSDDEEPDDSQDEEDEQYESGPKFHANERVLVLDSTRSSPESTNESNQQPLYEATIKQSGLRHVDPVTKKVLSETKFAFSKKRGRRRHHHTHQQQQYELHHQEKEWCYLVHFMGWNSRHDRWMTEADVFPNTDENRARLEGNTPKVVRAVKTEAPKEKKKMGRPKNAVEEGNDAGGNKNIGKLVEACELPFTLQRILVDDHDKITQTVYPPASVLSPRDPAAVYNKGITMLHKLPSTINIQNLLAKFLEAKKKDDLEEFVRERDKKSGIDGGVDESSGQQQNKDDDTGNDNKSIKVDAAPSSPKKSAVDVAQQTSDNAPPSQIISKDVLKLRKKKRKQTALSILELVDASLPKLLLYAEERNQFIEVMSVERGSNTTESNTDEKHQASRASTRPSQIYGGEHLLRLLVKLPHLITTATMPAADDEIADIAEFIHQFIIFLQKNCTEWQCKYELKTN